MKKIEIQKVAQLTGHKAGVYTLIPFDEPLSFLSGAGDKWLVKWQLNQPDLGRVVATVEHQIFSACYESTHQKLIIGNMNGGLHWIDAVEVTNHKNIAHHKKGVFGIRRIKEKIISIGGSGLLTVWDAATAQSIESVQLSKQALRSLDYHPQRNEIAIGSSDNSIYLLDADTLQLKHKINEAHQNSVFAVRYAPDGQYLLSGGRDAHLKAWSIDGTPTLRSSQAAHWFTINDIVFSSDGAYFATASRDKTVKIWDATNFKLLKVLDTVRDGGHVNSVNCLLWLPNEDYLISGSDDRTLIIWKVKKA